MDAAALLKRLDISSGDLSRGDLSCRSPIDGAEAGVPAAPGPAAAAVACGAGVRSASLGAGVRPGTIAPDLVTVVRLEKSGRLLARSASLLSVPSSLVICASISLSAILAKRGAASTLRMPSSARSSASSMSLPPSGSTCSSWIWSKKRISARIPPSWFARSIHSFGACAFELGGGKPITVTGRPTIRSNEAARQVIVF